MHTWQQLAVSLLVKALAKSLQEEFYHWIKNGKKNHAVDHTTRWTMIHHHHIWWWIIIILDGPLYRHLDGNGLYSLFRTRGRVRCDFLGQSLPVIVLQGSIKFCYYLTHNPLVDFHLMKQFCIYRQNLKTDENFYTAISSSIIKMISVLFIIKW